MSFLDEGVSDYLRRIGGEPGDRVLGEMEARASDHGFPIVGPVVGRLLELLTRSIGGRRVFELGSGYGYSGYWFSKAVGDDGEVVLTDLDPENGRLAKEYLRRAGLWKRCRFVIDDAISALGAAEGEFDVVYCDIDKGDYPKAFEVARERVRPGGFYLADNVLWSGRVAASDDDEWTQAIRRHNEMVYADGRYLSSIVPIRDGVIVALRVS
ncbi:MAG: O-methyltransferase [Actinomycetota bacterium]